MALEKPRQQPAHCLFPTCSWALERHGKNYIWIVTHPFHSFVGGFWRLTPADLTWCGMMRKDVVCWACWFLVLVCWCFCFALEVARCMGLLKRTQLSVFFCGRGIGKMRPAVWNKKYSIYVCHCESWHTCWAQYHWSAGWAGERFSAQRPRDDLALLGWLREAWCLPCFSNQLAGNDSAGQFFGDFAGASASIRSLRCVAQRTMDQVPYSVENYEGPTVRI